MIKGWERDVVNILKEQFPKYFKEEEPLTQISIKFNVDEDPKVDFVYLHKSADVFPKTNRRTKKKGE